jgi:hypothetical protein
LPLDDGKRIGGSSGQIRILLAKTRFARSMYIMTWVWGLGLVFEAAVRFWLAFDWPVEQFLAISPFISYGIYFSLMGWT